MFRLLLPFVCCAATLSASAQELHYSALPKQSFAYHGKVVVDLPDKVETYEGDLVYTVSAADAESLSLNYNGGLYKSVKVKDSARRFGPRGPDFFDGPRSPFSQNNFRGSERTSNDVTISPQGKVLRMRGDSQLPYLLGNVSLLPFEPLPKPATNEWRVGGAVTITEKDSRTDRFGPFGPFGRSQPEEVQTASETSSYAIKMQQGDLVQIAKSLDLKSPPQGKDSGYTVVGTGTWTFNRRLNLPESSHVDQKLVIQSGNQQVTIPITIDFRRLTDDELAQVYAARKQQEDEARQRLADLQKKQEDAKARNEAPLTPEEARAALAGLNSPDTATVQKTLADLQKRAPKPADPAVVAALEQRLQHADRTVREAAHRTLLGWSPAYKSRNTLDQAYAGPAPTQATNRTVGPETPLFVGQILLLRDTGAWYPVEILDLPANDVKIHFRGWSSSWDKVVKRDLLQLAPDELFQPAKPRTGTAVKIALPEGAPPKVATPAVAVAPPVPAITVRTWSDPTGTHKIEATYLALEEGKVRLRRQDGREIAVPLEKLSAADQQYVAQVRTVPENPFDVPETAPAKPPAVAAASEAVQLAQSRNNLKQIGLGVLNFADVYTQYPAVGSADDAGRPLLSWRVHILPFVDQNDLYEQFRLNEPWDSEHNRKLIPRMPKVFQSPGSNAAAGKTNYLAIRGEKTVFANPKPGVPYAGVRVRDIIDGTSNTLMVVEASDAAAVVWTQPMDLGPSATDPAKHLSGFRRGGFLGVFADGSVRSVSDKVSKQTLLWLFQRDDGEVVVLP